MRSIDYRNATWASLQDDLAGRRLAVYAELARLGPCTTRELAERSGMDILTVRPRVTELLQLGFAVEEPEAEGSKREGRYRALSIDEALTIFQARQAECLSGQLDLKLTA